MRLENAYENLTLEAKRQVVKEIAALLKSRDMKGGAEYVRQVCQGQRDHPCSREAAKVISGYFRGQIGIDVSPEEATGVRGVDGSQAATNGSSRATA